MSLSRVVCLRDIDYELTPDSAFHPLFLDAAKERISVDLSARIPCSYESIKPNLDFAMNRDVWGIVVEHKYKPLYVIQNLAFTAVHRNFQRVVRIEV